MTDSPGPDAGGAPTGDPLTGRSVALGDRRTGRPVALGDPPAEDASAGTAGAPGGPLPVVVEARLEELAAEHGLDGYAVDALRVLLDVYATDEHAATTVRAPEEAVDRHVADGLTGLSVPAIRRASRMVDIGTGAGVPALVLAAALPGCEVVALDTVGRKVAWTVACAERMGLSNVTGVHARAEAWPAGLGRFDVVTARAVAQLGVLVEYAAPLLAPGGRLVAWKGAIDGEEETVARSVARQLRMSPPELLPVKPWPDARARQLVVHVKSGPTPRGFPRQPGLPLRKPLR